MKLTKNDQTRKFINSIFKDITLCLGGIFLLNQVNDELIWATASSLEEIYKSSINTLKALNSKDKAKKKNKELKPHPAIEKLLITLEQDKRSLN